MVTKLILINSYKNMIARAFTCLSQDYYLLDKQDLPVTKLEKIQIAWRPSKIQASK